jgi:hypothetical protein
LDRKKGFWGFLNIPAERYSRYYATRGNPGMRAFRSERGVMGYSKVVDCGWSGGLIFDEVLWNGSAAEDYNMQGVRSLDEVYNFYRQPEYAIHGGPEMIRFLDAVSDILKEKLVYFGTSLMRLCLSRVATWPECQEQPSVLVFADGQYVNLSYHESWQDGDLFRTREDGIRCPADRARSALLELLARLKPTDAPPEPSL